MRLISPEPIFHIRADVSEIRHFGRTPYGERRVIDIVGGRVEGPRLNGRILLTFGEFSALGALAAVVGVALTLSLAISTPVSGLFIAFAVAIAVSALHGFAMGRFVLRHLDKRNGQQVLIATIGQLFCGMACVTSCSRMMYAFSRDRAVPGHQLWTRLNHHRVPAYAVLGSCGAALIITLPALEGDENALVDEEGPERRPTQHPAPLTWPVDPPPEEVHQPERHRHEDDSLDGRQHTGLPGPVPEEKRQVHSGHPGHPEDGDAAGHAEPRGPPKASRECRLERQPAALRRDHADLSEAARQNLGRLHELAERRRPLRQRWIACPRRGEPPMGRRRLIVGCAKIVAERSAKRSLVA